MASRLTSAPFVTTTANLQAKRGNHLPFQTTSQQAMETLAGGVGLGAPRHNQRRFSSSSKRIKKKKSSRFTLSCCGTNADLYDDGLNTSFVASSSPGEKVIGRIRAGSFSNVVPPMPSIDYLPARQQGHRRVRSKTSDGGGRARRLKAPATDSTVTPPPPISGSEKGEDRERETRRWSPSETLAGSCSDQSSATSSSPPAQVMTAIRANVSETTFAKEIDGVLINSVADSVGVFECVQAHRVALHTLVRSTEATQSDSPAVFRPVSSFALICTPSPVLVQQEEEHGKQSPLMDAEQPKRANKRRGGFLAMQSSDVVLLNEEEPRAEEGVDGMSSSLTPYPHGHAALASSRSSLASTLSKYSVPSPYLESKSKPSRATMGGPTEGVNPGQRTRYSPEPPASLAASRSSMASSQGTFSEQSPAIGDVLAHFPSLRGMNDYDSNQDCRFSSPSLSGQVDDETVRSSRINTFGPGRRFQGDLDGPAPVDSGHGNHERPFGLQNRRQTSSYSSTPSSPDHSPASTPSSAGSYSTISSTQSRRSHKRTAVLCGFPSNPALAALSRRSEAEGDLTWEEKLLALSNGEREQDQDYCDVDEEPRLRTSTSNHTLRSPMASSNRGRGSSTGEAPFSPPPDLPLPPVPPPSLKRRAGHHTASSNSLTHSSRQDLHSAPPFGRHSSVQPFPRSSTCPEMATSGMAF